MVKEYIDGETVTYIKDNLKMISDKEMEECNGSQDKYMWDSGKMVYRMD
jgi:hypothetical protein